MQFFIGEQGEAPVLEFGVADIVTHGQWANFTRSETDFALRRLGMSHLCEKVLGTDKQSQRQREWIHTRTEHWLNAVQKTEDGLEFLDYTEDQVDERIADDILFALKRTRCVCPKTISLESLPSGLLSNFWTAAEIRRVIGQMTGSGLLRVIGSLGPANGLAGRDVCLTPAGDKRARQTTPRRPALFDTASGAEREREAVRARLAGDELCQAAQLLEMDSPVPEVLHRAAGIIAGVVLETHLRRVVEAVNMARAEHERYQFRKGKDGIRAYSDWLIKNEVVARSERQLLDNCAHIRACCAHAPGENLQCPRLEDVRCLIARARRYCETISAPQESQEPGQD